MTCTNQNIDTLQTIAFANKIYVLQILKIKNLRQIISCLIQIVHKFESNNIAFNTNCVYNTIMHKSHNSQLSILLLIRGKSTKELINSLY